MTYDFDAHDAYEPGDPKLFDFDETGAMEAEVTKAEGGRPWDMADVEHLIEFPSIYDGWSAARLKDGRVVNRWDPIAYSRRYQATEMALEGWRKSEAP